MSPTKVYTPEEVAEILKIKERTVLEYLRLGRLKGLKMGGRIWRITEEQIDAFLEELQRESAEPRPKRRRKKAE
jgi:excisionase family DNA binding protein